MEMTLLLVRVVVGVFFAISGWHKLLSPSRHRTLVATLQADRVAGVGVMQWLIPAAELAGGLALVVGFLTPLAAVGLLVICLGACVVDGLGCIPDMKPLDKADWLDDVLYLPEALYVLLLLVIAVSGGGRWSVDALLLAWWQGGQL